MKAFKAIVPTDRFYKLPSDPAIEVSGCVAVVIEENREAALKRLAAYAAENGIDARWLEVAKLIELPIVNGVVLAWSEV